MSRSTSVTRLATRKYGPASVSPSIPVVSSSFGLSASPHTTNPAAGTPITNPQNHRQKRDMLALVHPIHEAATVTGRVAPRAAPARPSAVGPPSPVRRSKSDESGEGVTEPVAREPPAATGPVRLTRGSV